jgi:DNA polymerase-3 subunit delta'
MKELKDDQKSKRTRAIRDQLDRSLQDLLSLYRDVLFVQLGVEVELINEELRSSIERLANRATPTATRKALDAIQESRAAISASANPLLVLESLLINLARTS